MDFKKFQQQLSSTSQLPGLILLETQEGYIAAEVFKALRNHLSDCDEERFYATELGKSAASTLIASLKTLPMFTQRKLVILRQAEALDSQSEQMMVQYFKCEEEPAEAHLLLHYAKIRANAKLKKLAESQGWYIRAQLERRPEFAAWVKQIAADKGLQLRADVVRFLMEYVPMDLTLMERELEKLALFASERGSIDLKAVSELVCATNVESIFKLTDAIGEQRLTTALKLLRKMLAQGESPQMLLAMIGRHMRQLYRAKMVADQRISRQLVAEGLETHSPFVIEKASRQARRFRLPDLRRAMQRLYEVDRQLKSTGFAADILLERLVYDLAANQGES